MRLMVCLGMGFVTGCGMPEYEIVSSKAGTSNSVVTRMNNNFVSGDRNYSSDILLALDDIEQRGNDKSYFIAAVLSSSRLHGILKGPSLIVTIDGQPLTLSCGSVSRTSPPPYEIREEAWYRVDPSLFLQLAKSNLTYFRLECSQVHVDGVLTRETCNHFSDFYVKAIKR